MTRVPPPGPSLPPPRGGRVLPGGVCVCVRAAVPGDASAVEVARGAAAPADRRAARPRPAGETETLNLQEGPSRSRWEEEFELLTPRSRGRRPVTRCSTWSKVEGSWKLFASVSSSLTFWIVTWISTSSRSATFATVSTSLTCFSSGATSTLTSCCGMTSSWGRSACARGCSSASGSVAPPASSSATLTDSASC